MLGAGGGVGLAAVQLGVALGAHVTAVASSAEKLDAAADYGAERLINHADGDLRAALRAALPDGADVVVDPVGGELAEPALRSLRRGGRFVTVGYASGVIPRIPLNLVLIKGIHVLGFQFQDVPPDEFERNERELRDLLVSGRVSPHIGAVYPLAQTADGAASRRRRTRRRQDPDRRSSSPEPGRPRRKPSVPQQNVSVSPTGFRGRTVGHRQRLRLERTGGGAEAVLDGIRRCCPVRSGRSSPHSVTSVAPCSSAPSTPWRTRSSRSKRSAATATVCGCGRSLPGFQHRLEIEGLGAEHLEGAHILAAVHQHGDIPARHHPVVDPAAGEPHRVEDGRRDDIEPVPHVSLDGARSRASESAYSLNTSVSGIEGSSSHRISIPLMKARISTALLAASKSVR